MKRNFEQFKGRYRGKDVEKEDIVRESGCEKNICDGMSSDTEKVTTTTINMGSQSDIMILSRKFQYFRGEVQQEIAKLRKNFNYKVSQTSPSKVSVFDSSMVLSSGWC